MKLLIVVLVIGVVAVLGWKWARAHPPDMRPSRQQTIYVGTAKENQPVYLPGQIYSIADRRGFGLVKVLVIDEKVIHIRLYKNRYSQRPQTVDSDSLTLGTIHDLDGFGVGHLPLSRETFSSWKPALITRVPITKEELEGYQDWKESKGGVW